MQNTILTIGEILVEIMALERGNGFLHPIALMGPYPSGAPAIFIDQVGRLGQSCAIISAVGDDDFGRVNLERLRADGVDVSAVRIDPDRPTGSAFVRYREDGQRDFIFNIRHSAYGAFVRTAAADAAIDAAAHLHVMGTALASPTMAALILEAITRIKSRGGTVSFDPNARKELLSQQGVAAAFDEVLARTDLLMPSGDELFLCSREIGEQKAIDDLLARGLRAIVIKRGRAGASYHDRNGAIAVPGFAVEELDPTGAGDSFGATFVSGWLGGADPAHALTRACAAGALAVTVKGPMGGNSDAATIEALIARAGRTSR